MFKYKHKFGEVIYDATVEKGSTREQQLGAWRKRYIRMNLILVCSLIVYTLFLGIASGYLIIVTMLIMVFTLPASFVLWRASKQDPRRRVILTKKGIFYGYEETLNYKFVPYEDIIDVKYDTIYLAECIKITRKSLLGFTSQTNILLDDIQDVNVFLTKLKEKVPSVRSEEMMLF